MKWSWKIGEISGIGAIHARHFSHPYWVGSAEPLDERT